MSSKLSARPAPWGRARWEGIPVRSITKPLFTILGSLLAGAALAAACTAGGTASPELIAHSVDAVADAGSFRASFSMQAALPGAPGGSFTMEGTGEFDQAEKVGAMTIAVGGAGERFEIEMRFFDDLLYMDMGAMAAAAGAPTRWVSVDLSSIPGNAGMFGSASPGTSDPSQFLEMLRGAGKAEVVGREDVRGVPTTHYAARVSIQDALDASAGEDREGLEEMLAGLGSGGDLAALSMPVEVWIDEAGLPRRLTLTLDLGGITPEVPAGATMTVTMEMFDFGADVGIERPPAGEVTDMTQLVGSGF